MTRNLSELVEALRKAAISSSDIQRRMAEQKSLRNSDGKHKDLYMWSAPERTLEGQAAATLQLILDPPDALVEAIIDAVEDEPFQDDIYLTSTTQQRQRCAHYTRAVLTTLAAELGKGNG